MQDLKNQINYYKDKLQEAFAIINKLESAVAQLRNVENLDHEAHQRRADVIPQFVENAKQHTLLSTNLQKPGYQGSCKIGPNSDEVHHHEEGMI